MSRRPKKIDYQINKIKENGYKRDNFFRLHRSLFENESFRKLPSTTQVIYLAIALQCGREDPSCLECCFPESQYKNLGFTKKQVMSAVKNLEEEGFIRTERYKSRKPNRYHLSAEWKNKNQ